MTQADIEARAKNTLTVVSDNAGSFNPREAVVSMDDAIAAMLAFRAEARREAFAEAAEVARTFQGEVSATRHVTARGTLARAAIDGNIAAAVRIATAIAEQGRVG